MYNSKDAILNAIKTFSIEAKIPLDQICVGGGAAFVLMGLSDSTNDLNLWVDDPHFSRLAETHQVINHPMRDTVVNVGDLWVRVRNRYFKFDTLHGVSVFDPLALLVFKRGGYQDVKRPLEKRQQDYEDIVLLGAILAKRNRVKEPAAVE